MSGDIAKTISSTLMLNRLAKAYGLQVYETPVGFDVIARLILEEDILLGGEESGSISIKGHIPEADGILMGLLLMEIIAELEPYQIQIEGKKLFCNCPTTIREDTPKFTIKRKFY